MRGIRVKPSRMVLLGLALAAAIAAAWWLLSGPRTLTLAYPREGDDARVIQAFAQILEQQKEDVRLRLVPAAGVAESAQALERREVDLAVVRPDVALPVNGLTVAILREEAAIILAPKTSKIEEVDDLAKRRLGLVSRHGADQRFIESVLAYYELAAPQVVVSQVRPEDVEEALKAKRVDAVAVIAAPGSREATEILKSVERAATNREVNVLALAGGDAMSQRMPSLAAIEIPAGALGGRPRQPAEALNVVGVSYRLVGRADLDPGIVAKVTQQLFEERPRLARAAPGANLVKAPESIMSATLPNHPGAIQYLERETLTFFERYGDWVYLAMFSMGGVGSGLAWLRQRVVRRRRELVDEVLDRLMCILSEAREAKSPGALDDLALEVDGLLTHSVRYARSHTINGRIMSTLMLALDGARAAISDRRRDMVHDRERDPARDPARELRPAAE